MGPRYIPPENINGTVLSLPFPIDDIPIGVSCAKIDISPIEMSRSYNNTNISYRSLLTAHYTIQHTGNEPATVRFALHLPALRTSWIRHVPAQDISVYIDNEFYSAYKYIIHENFENTGARNLARHATPIFTDLIDDIVMYARPTRQLYMANAFDADEQAILYSFSVNARNNVRGIMGMTFVFEYNHNETSIILDSRNNSSRFVQRSSNRRTGITTLSVYVRDFQREQFELFVIGEDTLTWEIIPRFFDNVGEREGAENFSRVVLNVDTSITTPRGHFYRMQNTITYPYVKYPRDFMLSIIDGILTNPPRNGRYRGQGYVNLFDIGMPSLPNAIIISVDFEPGQERVLSLTFPMFSGKEWDRGMQQSLFHYTILTEAAYHWAFFDSLEVTAHHPDNVIDVILADGFELFGNKAVLSIDDLTDNIHFGFVLTDERANHGSGIGFVFFFLFIYFLHFLWLARVFWIGLGCMILVLVAIKCYRKYFAKAAK